MMHSHKFNQNLFGLTFVVLLVFICQTTAKNDCQRDLTKTGKEMLASAQTLMHGKKTPKTEFQEDPIKAGQELVDTASTLFDGMKSGSFDSEMAIKLVQKYAFDVLCNIKPNFEMNENFKLQNNFCQQLKNGKSMEEAAVKVKSAAIKLMQNLDKPKIFQNIRQKIAENSFLGAKNKEKMAKLLGQFQLGMDKYYGVINDRLNVAHSRDEADHSKGANAFRQHQRRRRKRMQTLEVMMSDATRRSQNPAAEFQPTRYGAAGCITLFVVTACTVIAAIFLALRLSSAGNHTLIIVFLVISIVACLFEFFMLIWHCVDH